MIPVRLDPFLAGRPLIAASILSADFAALGEDVDAALGGGADFLHLDVMDGHFVPNISFGPGVVAACRRHCGAAAAGGAFLDVHLMISEPLRYAPAFVKAGADSITFHVETVAEGGAVEAAKRIRDMGVGRVGITLNPATPASAVFGALSAVDYVLVMSVNPGFGGQKFMPEALDKVRELRPRLSPGQRLEIDGGINLATIAEARRAGVDWFVIGSALFDPPDRVGTIAALRAGMDSAG